MVVTNGFDYKVENHLIPAFEELSRHRAWRCVHLNPVVHEPGRDPANSIDYIFTDPPYADKVQYGELNFVWEAWLDFDTTGTTRRSSSTTCGARPRPIGQR